jgi:WS/DGAT/MGAT family acyltransferase
VAHQGHRDRLTAIDASFLHQERESSHMHVGAIVILEGPAPSHGELAEHIESRLHLVPRYRQKLSFPRFDMGRPFWIDDRRFNIDYHVRHTALAAPGSIEQLRVLAGRIFSQRLDRSKPLWEMWLVQGLEHGRVAVISKTHHALVDGVSGLDIATVLFDLQPTPPDADPQAWEPAPEPSQAELVAEGVKGVLRTPARLVGGLAKAAATPASAVGRAREAIEGVGEMAWATLNPAPEVPLNVPIGSHRRVFWLQRDLADFKAIKDSLGGTVNDAFLAVVAGGLGRWLRSRGVRIEGLELRGLVPVSIRADDQKHALGNRIAALRGPLPVYAEDPVERLRIVREAMQGIKDSKQALGAEVIAGIEDFAPPTLLALASRLNFSTRLFNLIVTNIPGPQFPLYLLGRQMEELIPIAFLPEDHALAIAAMSYNGKLDFGLLGDYDAMPDLEQLAGHFDAALDELLDAARAARPAKPGKRAAGAKKPGKRAAGAKKANGRKRAAPGSKAASGQARSTRRATSSNGGSSPSGDRAGGGSASPSSDD